MKLCSTMLTIAAIVTPFTTNALVFVKDNKRLKIYGSAEVGGTFVSDKEHTPFEDLAEKKSFVNTSSATLGFKAKADKLYVKFEVDAEHQGWGDNDRVSTFIDKAFVRYKLTPTQFVEYGRTDTAYDHYDAFGDFANELSVNIFDASDQDNTFKYRGSFDSLKLGISHSLKGWDAKTPGGNDYEVDSREGAVTSGYIGYFGEQYSLLTAAETVDDRGEIYSLHGKAIFNDWQFGGFVSFSDKEKADKDTYTYLISAKYALTEQLALFTTGNAIQAELGRNDKQWLVIGGEYHLNKNIIFAAELSYGDVLDNKEGTLTYIKAYYCF